MIPDVLVGFRQSLTYLEFVAMCHRHQAVNFEQRNALPGGEARVIGNFGLRIRSEPPGATFVQLDFEARRSRRAHPGSFGQRKIAFRGNPGIGGL